MAAYSVTCGLIRRRLDQLFPKIITPTSCSPRAILSIGLSDEEKVEVCRYLLGLIGLADRGDLEEMSKASVRFGFLLGLVTQLQLFPTEDDLAELRGALRTDGYLN